MRASRGWRSCSSGSSIAGGRDAAVRRYERGRGAHRKMSVNEFLKE
jgi:hypothetical protein